MIGDRIKINPMYMYYEEVMAYCSKPHNEETYIFFLEFSKFNVAGEFNCRFPYVSDVNGVRKVLVISFGDDSRRSVFDFTKAFIRYLPENVIFCCNHKGSPSYVQSALAGVIAAVNCFFNGVEYSGYLGPLYYEVVSAFQDTVRNYYFSDMISLSQREDLVKAILLKLGKEIGVYSYDMQFMLLALREFFECGDVICSCKKSQSEYLEYRYPSLRAYNIRSMFLKIMADSDFNFSNHFLSKVVDDFSTLQTVSNLANALTFDWMNSSLFSDADLVNYFHENPSILDSVEYSKYGRNYLEKF